MIAEVAEVLGAICLIAGSLFAVVGGIGDIRGAFLGGFLLGFIEIFVAAVFPSTLRDLIAFALLLLFLSIKPTGIFGVARAQKI